MNDSFYQNKVVVITGGSSGIGLALAHEFAKQNARVVLIARDRERLASAQLTIQQSINRTVGYYSADVSNAEAIKEAIDAIGNEEGRIDLLICCAGILTCGRFSDQQVDALTSSVNVNYLGSVYTAKASWPYLKASRGQLGFVSSVAGYMGLIGYSSYAPTKFAITGLAECLRYEGKDDGIQVSVIYPPDTDTPMLQEERKQTLPECIALAGNIKPQSAQKVAALYLRGLQQGKAHIYCDTNSRFLRILKNNFPGLFWRMTNDVIKKARRGMTV